MIFVFLLFAYLSVLNGEDIYPRLRETSKAELPKNFRTSGSPYLDRINCKMTREGLGQLRISGSGQFSLESLKYFLSVLPKETVFIVDLRGEFHGFINGLDLSWKKKTRPSYSYYQGCKSEVLEKLEKERLQALITRKKEVYQTDGDPVEILAIKAQSERELAEGLRVNYMRLPIADGQRPSDDEVDRFLFFYKSLPKDRWLHFHCAAGEGRTTTLMSMVDMMENPHLSLQSILERQRALGGIDLKNPEVGGLKEKVPWAEERYSFLKSFHQYCGEAPNVSWSSWLRSGPESSIITDFSSNAP